MKKSLLIASVIGALYSPSLAMAGAMPEDEVRIMSPLEKALVEIQSKETIVKTTDVPVSIVPEKSKIQEEEIVVVEEVASVPEMRQVHTQPNTSFLGLSVGLYSVSDRDELATAFNIEWQPGVTLLGKLKPMFGAMITTDGSAYGYGGLGLPLALTEKFTVTPSVAVGLYNQGGGIDLDQSIAYRLGTEFSWALKDDSKIGLNAHVLTNGESLNSDDRTEVISLTYTKPLQSFTK